MRKIIVVILLLTLAACGGGKIESKLAELEKKPKAADATGAKALYAEANNFRRWLEANEPTSELLERANALERERRNEMVEIAGNGILDGIKNALGGLLGDNAESDNESGKGIESMGVGKALDGVMDKVLGTNDPRMKKFGCPEMVIVNGKEVPFDITKEGASRYCP